MIREPCCEGVIRGTRAPAGARARTAVLLAAILGSSMVFIDGSAVNVALPVLRRELGADMAQVQWVVEAYLLFLSALMLVGGALGDRYGRRRLFIFGIVLFTLSSLACMASTSAAMLVVARAVQGIGGALLTPGSLAIIGANFDGASRGKAIGAWSGATAVTSTLGPLVGGTLVQLASWRLVFALNAPLAAAALVLLRDVPESKDAEATGELDWRGACFATLGLGALTYAALEREANGSGAAPAWLAAAVAVAAMAAFLARERAAKNPMMPLTLFAGRSFRGTNAVTLLLYGALGGALYYVPFELIDRQGYSAAAAGAALLPMIAIIALLSRYAGSIADRMGARIPLTIGSLVAGAGFALFAYPGIGTSYWSTFFPAAVVLGVGMGIVVAPLTTAVLAAVPPGRTGIASGINNAIARAAGLLGIAALGLAFSTGMRHVMEAAAVLALAAALASWTTLSRRIDEEHALSPLP